MTGEVKSWCGPDATPDWRSSGVTLASLVATSLGGERLGLRQRPAGCSTFLQCCPGSLFKGRRAGVNLEAGRLQQSITQRRSGEVAPTYWQVLRACRHAQQSLGVKNPDVMSLAALQHFSRFPSIPVEALADLDAVLDWSAAKPAGQRTLSAVLAAEVCPALLQLSPAPVCAASALLLYAVHAARVTCARLCLTDAAAAQLDEAASKAAGKAGAVPSSPSGPLAAAATTSGGTSGNTSGAAGTSAPARSARVAKRAASEEDVHSESDEDDEEDEDASDDGATARRGRPRRSTRFAGGVQASKVRFGWLSC